MIRTANEEVKPFFFIYKSIYFDKVISKDLSKIDNITDMDAAFMLVEQYANTGFDVLARMRKEYSEDEIFTKKLLSLTDEMQKEFMENYCIKTLYTEQPEV